MTQEITLAQAAKAAAEHERAQIVAWLRAQVTCRCGRHDCMEDGYPLGYAESIEAGEHWK